MTAQDTILIVEDNQDIMSLLAYFLEAEGYAVKTAENGRLALEIVQTIGVPTLILLDMKMPVMDGWEFAAEFDRRYGRCAPIVVMSAARDGAQYAKEINANGWLNKPFTLGAVLDAVKKFRRKPQ